MNSSKKLHDKIKATLMNFVDQDIKDLLTNIINNKEPYDQRCTYEENIILKIQHEKTLIKLNNNLKKLISIIKNTKGNKFK